MYAAVVLTPQSAQTLKDWATKYFKFINEDGWDIKCHHMTIKFGSVPEYLKNSLGTTQTLYITAIACNNFVAAAKVDGFPSENAVPHVTIAVNTRVGGKAVMSNELTGWAPIRLPFNLTGTVEGVDE